jgi:hypothetical protein
MNNLYDAFYETIIVIDIHVCPFIKVPQGRDFSYSLPNPNTHNRVQLSLVLR